MIGGKEHWIQMVKMVYFLVTMLKSFENKLFTACSYFVIAL